MQATDKPQQAHPIVFWTGLSVLSLAAVAPAVYFESWLYLAGLIVGAAWLAMIGLWGEWFIW